MGRTSWGTQSHTALRYPSLSPRPCWSTSRATLPSGPAEAALARGCRHFSLEKPAPWPLRFSGCSGSPSCGGVSCFSSLTASVASWRAGTEPLSSSRWPFSDLGTVPAVSKCSSKSINTVVDARTPTVRFRISVTRQASQFWFSYFFLKSGNVSNVQEKKKKEYGNTYVHTFQI